MPQKSLQIRYCKWGEVSTSTKCKSCYHYGDVIMSAMASRITSLTIVYSIVYSGPDQRKHQSTASLAFVRGIHRWSVNSPHKGPVTRKFFPFDDVIMSIVYCKEWELCKYWCDEQSMRSAHSFAFLIFLASISESIKASPPKYIIPHKSRRYSPLDHTHLIYRIF